MGNLISSRYYPSPGEVLVHKTFGFKGVYLEEVYTNSGKRHFLVQDEAQGKRYVLPDNEWRKEEKGL